jgi:hypothetical protein
MSDREERIRRQQELQAVYEEAKAQLMQFPGVVGVGIGLKERGTTLTHEFCFRVYVEEKVPLAQLAPDEVIPAEVMGFPTDVIKVPEATVTAFVEREDRSDYRPVQGGISINPEGKSGYGTLGWFGTLNSNPATKVLLTNKHVIFDGATGTFTDAKRVGQANYSKVCCCECGEIGTSIVGIMNTSVDVAIVRLDSDITPNLIINNNTAAQQISVTGTAAAVIGDTVRKVGARSAFTTGTVADIAGTTATTGTLSDGTTVTVTRTNSEILVGAAATETYEIENGKKAFSNSGDSGSVVVNEAGAIVGLLYGGSNPANPTINAFVTPIATVLSALSSAGQAITLSNSPSGGGSGMSTRVSRRITGTRLDDILEQTLQRDPEDEPFIQAVRVHFEEMLDLVNHSRPVTVAWHRKQGPAFLGAFMRSVKEPDYRIPHEIEGISRQHALNAMSVVFEEHGSPALKAAIQQYGIAVLYACGRYDTVEEIVKALNQLPIHAAPDAVQ